MGARKWAISLACGLAVISVAWLVSRRSVTAHDLDSREREQARREANEHFKRVQIVPLQQLNSIESLMAVVSGSTVEDEPGASHSSEDAAGVRRAIAELIHYRYCQPDPQVYMDWRRTAGYTMRDRPTMLDVLREASTYRWCTGETPPTEVELDEIFRRIWHCYAKRATQYSRPRGIASEASGLTIRFGELTMVGSTRRYPRPAGVLGEASWHAPPQGAPVMWFAPSPSGLDCLQAGRKVRAATAGVIVECEDGSRYPMHFRLIQRSGERAWLVDMVLITGFEHADTQALF